MKLKIWSWVLTSLGILFIGIYIWANWPYWELERSLSEVRTEEAVKARFGEPDEVCDLSVSSCLVEGYSKVGFPDKGRVDVYFESLPGREYEGIVIYFQYSQGGNLEKYYVAGS